MDYPIAIATIDSLDDFAAETGATQLRLIATAPSDGSVTSLYAANTSPHELQIITSSGTPSVCWREDQNSYLRWKKVLRKFGMLEHAPAPENPLYMITADLVSPDRSIVTPVALPADSYAHALAYILYAIRNPNPFFASTAGTNENWKITTHQQESPDGVWHSISETWDISVREYPPAPKEIQIAYKNREDPDSNKSEYLPFAE